MLIWKQANNFKMMFQVMSSSYFEFKEMIVLQLIYKKGLIIS